MWYGQVMERIQKGQKLLTPGRGIPPRGQKPFYISNITNEYIIIRVGLTHTPIRIERNVICNLEEIFQKNPNISLRISSLHEVNPLPNSLDEIVRRLRNSSLACANYVAAILVESGYLEYVMVNRQKHVRLSRGPAGTNYVGSGSEKDEILCHFDESSFPFPSIEDLKKARELFEANEPRDLFYRVAKELVDLALRGKSSLSVAEALAVLLQTWNKAFYQFRGFDAEHYKQIEALLSNHLKVLKNFRERRIDDFDEICEKEIVSLFVKFEEVLGPVGASKALHLLAPNLFPIWDRSIASAYKLPLAARGENGEKYFRFMKITQMQVVVLGGRDVIQRNPLKALDEYNYCKFTKRWM